MKTYFFIIAILSVLLPTKVYATPIDRATANQYFLNCKANPDPRFTEETQEQFCGCTASQMLTGFTAEDMKLIGNPNDPAARSAVNKLMINIYAPCIQYPTKEFHYQNCIQNPKTKILGNPERVCGCAANKVAEYLQVNSKNLLRNILRNNPNILDPMHAIYNDPGFNEFAQKQLVSCITR